MTAQETTFNDVATKMFTNYADTVRGYLRYELVKRNLVSALMQDEFFAHHQLDVVDVGGGSGVDASWLLELGHQVTILEPSEVQLRQAHERRDRLPAEVAERLRLVHGTPHTLALSDSDAVYDLALCHGVAMYMSNPGKFIKDVSALVKPGGGRLSLLEKGLYGSRIRLTHERKYHEARELQRTQRSINHLGYLVTASKPEDIKLHLKNAGAAGYQWYGVRVTSDLDDRNLDEITKEELTNMADEEYAAGRRRDLRGSGALLHFIAKMDSQH